MLGDATIIDSLNKLLANELAAMDQYFVHSCMYDDWGIKRLQERIAHEFEDEKQHAHKLIQRILFLEGTPDLVQRAPIKVGGTVPEMLNNDLDIERKVVGDLRNAMALCESVRDYNSRDILLELLEETEHDHVWWLEKQLGLIDKIGLENYIQSMSN